MKKPKKITILTATGCKNLWDECILQQEIALLNEYYQDPKIDVFTYDADSNFLTKEKNYHFIQYFPSQIRKHPFRNILYAWKNLWSLFSSDLIIIGGGWIFYGDTNRNQFQKLMNQWKWRVWIARFFWKIIFYWSISIEIKNPENFKYLHPLFRGKKIIISVRDKKSQTIIEDLWYTSHFLPDAVLSMHHDQWTRKNNTKQVGLAFRWGCLINEKENIEAIIQLIRKSWYEPIFFSHSFHEKTDENDYLCMKDIADKLWVRQTNTIQESINLYTELDYVIAIRLHASILSTSNTIPFIALSYSRKTEEFSKMIQYPYWMNAQEFTIEDFKNMWTTLIKNTTDTTIQLKNAHATYQKIIRDTLFSLLP